MTKLVNGRIDTATMIRLLKKHIDDKRPWSATSYGKLGSEPISVIGERNGDSVSLRVSPPEFQLAFLPERSDWVIYAPWTIERDIARSFRRRKRDKVVQLGTVTLGTSGAVKTSAGDERVMDELFALPDGEWVVEARRR